MGEYYKWVNIDKREYLNPIDFNIGCKSKGSSTRGNSLLNALHQLLASDWKNDKIIFLGDEIKLNGNEQKTVLSNFYEQTVEYGSPGNIYDVVCDTYKNISGLFKAAEEEVRSEIDFCLLNLDDFLSSDILKSYGIDIEQPYKGRFIREGKSLEYVINYTKNIAYSYKQTVIMFKDGTVDDSFDPLPLLMGFGNSVDCGEWVGDIVGVSDTLPEGIQLLDELFHVW